MKHIAPLLLLILLAVPSQAQRISAFPETLEIPTNYLFLVADPGVATYKTTLDTLARILGTTIDVSAAQLNASSNGLYTVETTRNAAVSNAVVALIGSGSGAISNANILWVDKGGTNGVRGRLDRPFPHPRHAWSNAIAGDTIVVLPGTYHGSSNLMKVGVNWQGIGWPTLTYTNMTNDGGVGIFDGRRMGATTSHIHGFNYVYSTGLPSVGADDLPCCAPITADIPLSGVLVVTNPTTVVDFEFGSIEYMCVPTAGGSQAINVQNSKLTKIRGRSIRDMFYSSNYFVGLDSGSTPIYLASGAEGFYYERGECHIDVDNVQVTKFLVYANCQVDSLNETNNLFLKFGKTSGVLYLQTLCTNPPNWKIEVDAQSLTGATNTSFISAYSGSAIYIIGGGSYFIDAQQIINGKHRAAPIYVSGGAASSPTVKITSKSVLFDIGPSDGDAGSVMCQVLSGNVDLDVLHWEDRGGATIGLDLQGGSTTVSGGRLAVTNGIGVKLSGAATARLNNMTIDTSFTSLMTNTPVFVSTNGLILNNCVLVAPAAAPSVMAVSAKSVLAYGVLTSNKTNSPNVTVQVGSQIVDSNVR